MKRLPLAVLLGVSAFLFLWRLGTRPLYGPDEGRYAEVGREMLATGDWIVPKITGVPYPDKPPLLYWMEALGMAVFGPNEWGARILVALAMLLGVFLAFRLGVEMGGEENGIVGGAILASTVLYAGLARVVITDGVLSVAILGAFLGFWRAWSGKSGAVAMWVCLALSFLAKGPVGPGLFALAAVPFWYLAKPRPPLARFRPILGPALFVALALPWTIAMELRLPGYIRFFYWNQNVEAFLSKGVHHASPWYYAPPIVFGSLIPWSLFLPAAIWEAWAKHRRKIVEKDPATLLLLLWSATNFLFFTVSVSKLGTYFLPMFPAAALLVSPYLLRRPRRWARPAFATLGGIVVVALFVAPNVRADVPAVSWFIPAGLALFAGALWTGFRLREGQAQAATLGFVAAAAIGVAFGTAELPRWDDIRGPRALLLRNAGRIRACDAVLSERFPVGMAEFYLGKYPVQLGTPHDYETGRKLTPSPEHFLEKPDLASYLAIHPRTCVLSAESKVEDLTRDFPQLSVVDRDSRNALLFTAEALK